MGTSVTIGHEKILIILFWLLNLLNLINLLRIKCQIVPMASSVPKNTTSQQIYHSIENLSLKSSSETIKINSVSQSLTYSPLDLGMWFKSSSLSLYTVRMHFYLYSFPFSISSNRNCLRIDKANEKTTSFIIESKKKIKGMNYI